MDARLPKLLLVAAAALSLSLVSCFGGHGGGGGGGGSTSNVASISISPNPPFMTVGNTLQLTATAKDASGNVISGVTLTWTSSAPGIATINSSGLASGVAVGTTQVMAAVAGGPTSGPLTLTVNAPLALATQPLSLGALTFAYITTGLTNSGARTGGVGPFTWSLLNGNVLPSGLSLAANGSISGTPTVDGTTSFLIQVTDSETPPVAKQANFSMTVVNPAIPCAVITNTAPPAILTGTYAFLLEGLQASTANGAPVAMAGSFTANGTGGITTGEEDLNLASGPQHITISGGSYAVNTSGQGCVQLKYASGATIVFHFALTLNSSPATHARIIEFDAYQGSQGGGACKLASGVMLLQNTTEFALASLAPRFAFGEDGFDSSGGHVAVGGSFSMSNTGAISSLAEDIDDAGATQSVTAQSGAVVATATTATTGRVLPTLTISGTQFHFASYIVNKNEVFLIAIDPLSKTTPILSGRAILTANPSLYTLSGNSIFRATGVDAQGDGVACAASAPCAVTEIGVTSVNSGKLTGTVYFSQAGVSASQPINDTYILDNSVGRVGLTQVGGGVTPVLYLATPSAAIAPDLPESITGFVVGGAGDRTALFGFSEAQPAGPYSLNSGSYIFGTEDGAEITANFVVGNGSMASGTFNVNGRDIASAGTGLNLYVPTTVPFTINPDGTIASASNDGATNSTSGTPGKALWFGTSADPAFNRVAEP